MKKAILAATLLALIISILSANSNFGILEGTVKDESGKPLIGASVNIEGTSRGTYVRDKEGKFRIANISSGIYKIRVNALGYEEFCSDIKIAPDSVQNIDIVLAAKQVKTESIQVRSANTSLGEGYLVRGSRSAASVIRGDGIDLGGFAQSIYWGEDFNTEQYDHFAENEFKYVPDNPLSTFSIDVDAASYSNMRRFLNQGSLPPESSVRIEEFINYFDYDYPQPADEHPFSITTEVSACPWNKEHRLVHIGLQGKRIETKKLPAGNLVFLIDVSGSMSEPNKLPLVKSSLKLLVSQLRSNDKIAIVVYAGAAGLVLPSSAGSEKSKIIDAIENLSSGGSTAGAEGIQLAYKVAKENFIKNGYNRIILATDGDFNIGISSDGELVKLIEEKRNEGIYLTVLGFGMGNYKDSKIEKLADKGNGNYAYIDNLLEAKKVLINEIGATLLTIAKDVKLQIEFNPAQVTAYRLIGYENRMLNKEDFNDDKKDAGELGAGHSVTALYEIVPQGVKWVNPKVDSLKYQSVPKINKTNSSFEILTVKFRYKDRNEDNSKLISKSLIDRGNAIFESSIDFRFSAAVAEYGMLLSNSKYKGSASFDSVINLAKGSVGNDENGYRNEFLNIVKLAKQLTESLSKE